MKAQRYKLPMTFDNMVNVKEGHFVLPGNDSDIVSGFISNVDKISNMMEFCLFDPVEVPENAIVINETISQDIVAQLLAFALDKNPAMKDEWLTLINDPKHHVD